MIKKLLGLAPKPTKDGAFSPSSLALKIATSSVTDLSDYVYPNKYKGSSPKILMICTEEKNMTMKNGKLFSTGNHPVEMMLPMIHLTNAGFEIDIVTPTGKPVKIEMWAMPEKDKIVMSFYQSFKNQFETPRSLENFVTEKMESSTEYSAIFIPGGHGAMLGLPNNKHLNALLYWANKKDLYTLAICHGPAALLAAQLNNKEEFLYKGYEIAAFPDSVDKQTPMLGYMPGHMPWKFGEKLNSLGVKIINTKADKTCHIDRKLITGSSPQAANEFGKLIVKELMK